MPLNIPPDIVFAWNLTTAVAGPSIGNGRSLRFSNATGVNRNQYPLYIKFRLNCKDTVTTGGGTATVQIQDCDDNASWVTEVAKVLLIPAGVNQVSYGLLFKTSKRFVRCNISSISGGTAPFVYIYGSYGTYGM